MKKSMKICFLHFFQLFPILLKLICPESVDITEKELNPFKWEYKVWTLFLEKSKGKYHPALDAAIYIILVLWMVRDIAYQIRKREILRKYLCNKDSWAYCFCKDNIKWASKVHVQHIQSWNWKENGFNLTWMQQTFEAGTFIFRLSCLHKFFIDFVDLVC